MISGAAIVTLHWISVAASRISTLFVIAQKHFPRATLIRTCGTQRLVAKIAHKAPAALSAKALLSVIVLLSSVASVAKLSLWLSPSEPLAPGSPACHCPPFAFGEPHLVPNLPFVYATVFSSRPFRVLDLRHVVFVVSVGIIIVSRTVI